jgi:hypothetical protein
MLAKIVCFIAALSANVGAQFTNPVGSGPITGPVSGPGYMLMNTMGLPPSGNYSIGYLPYITTGVAGSGGATGGATGGTTVGTNMSACRRIQMFKFPALLSGTVTTITMNTLPSAGPEVCDVGFNLYTFSGNQQVGTTYIGAVSSTSATTGIPGNGPPAFEVSSMVNVSSAGWYMTNGTVYYLTIQPFTWNRAGSACNMRVPYGLDTAKPPHYTIVAQQGPVGTPCGASPWTTVAALDGGYIHMSIAGVPFVSASASATPTQTQSAYLRGSVTASPTPTSVGMMTSASPTGTVTPTGTPTGNGAIDTSASDTPTGTDSPSVSSSQTPTPSSSSSPSASSTASTTPSFDSLASVTASMTASPTPGASISNTPTSAPAPTASYSATNSGKNMTSGKPIDTPYIAAAAAAGPAAPVGSIVGGVFAAIVVVAVIGSVVAFNLSRTVRAQVGKYTGIKDARSPVSSQSVIVMNPAGNTVSVYHNAM